MRPLWLNFRLETMKPLLTFYGDDFTGSTAVMEVLSFAGVSTMLFLEPPELDVLKEYPTLQAIGVAGIARSKDPAWMKSNLPSVFKRLKKFGAPVSHYKVCSTFDSSPEIGSIGVATEIGDAIFSTDWVPLVVGAPDIQRYQAFGTLFAKSGASIHRLDRHPVMSRHPVTPMNEADLTRHLTRQTNLKIGIISLAEIKAGQSHEAVSKCLSDGARILAIDVVDDETLTEAGRLIWPIGSASCFAVGSQGVEYALVAHWRKIGTIEKYEAAPALTPVDQIFAVSGSCSATTEDQIATAEAHGFQIINFDVSTVTQPKRFAAELERVRNESLIKLSKNYDVLVATARGPDDLMIKRMEEAVSKTTMNPSAANERLGEALGKLVSDIRRTTNIKRIAIAGGDTSGRVLSSVGAQALSAVAPISPGAPLCRLHTNNDAEIDGLELTLKGGQMGEPHFFLQAKGVKK